jgi:hypothetical protein
MNNAVRLSCWAAVAGAVLMTIGVLVFSVLVPGHAPDGKTAQSASFIGINVIGVIATALLVYGMPGLYARQPEGWGRMGLAGMVLIALAQMLFGSVCLMAATFYSWLGEKAPDLFKDPNPAPLVGVVFLIWFVAMVAGNILMAIPVLRRRVGPRWIGFVLIGAAVMSVVYMAAALTPPDVVVSLVGGLGPILMCVALGYLGYLGTSDRRAVRVAPAASAAQRA